MNYSDFCCWLSCYGCYFRVGGRAPKIFVCNEGYFDINLSEFELFNLLIRLLRLVMGLEEFKKLFLSIKGDSWLMD